MNRGVIAGLSDELQRIEPFSTSRSADGVELTDQVDVNGVKRTTGGLDITFGLAATQDRQETESVALQNGTIDVSTTTGVETTCTEFLSVSGEFVSVSSSDGAFAFSLLDSRYDVGISRAELDLDSFWQDTPDATPWKVGFYGNDGPVENGVVHGEDVLEGGVFGQAIADLQKNQLGVSFDRDGDTYKLMLTSSGYVDVYQPTTLSKAEFAQFVVKEVLPHCS